MSKHQKSTVCSELKNFVPFREEDSCLRGVQRKILYRFTILMIFYLYGSTVAAKYLCVEIKAKQNKVNKIANIR